MWLRPLRSPTTPSAMRPVQLDRLRLSSPPAKTQSSGRMPECGSGPQQDLENHPKTWASHLEKVERLKRPQVVGEQDGVLQEPGLVPNGTRGITLSRLRGTLDLRSGYVTAPSDTLRPSIFRATSGEPRHHQIPYIDDEKRRGACKCIHL